MRTVKVVKRADREAANQRAEIGSTVQRSAPELIVKGWIAAARERRKVDQNLGHRNFRLWEESLSISGS
jgi:hypothetical protein